MAKSSQTVASPFHLLTKLKCQFTDPRDCVHDYRNLMQFFSHVECNWLRASVFLLLLIFFSRAWDNLLKIQFQFCGALRMRHHQLSTTIQQLLYYSSKNIVWFNNVDSREKMTATECFAFNLSSVMTLFFFENWQH